MGFVGAMIAEYPVEEKRYDHPMYEPFWAAAQDCHMPLSLHTATRRQGANAGMVARTVRDASRRATKAFSPAISVCDMIFSGVFDRYPGLMGEKRHDDRVDRLPVHAGPRGRSWGYD